MFHGFTSSVLGRLRFLPFLAVKSKLPNYQTAVGLFNHMRS